jgi:hypothetical protein
MEGWGEGERKGEGGQRGMGRDRSGVGGTGAGAHWPCQAALAVAAQPGGHCSAAAAGQQQQGRALPSPAAAPRAPAPPDRAGVGTAPSLWQQGSGSSRRGRCPVSPNGLSHSHTAASPGPPRRPLPPRALFRSPSTPSRARTRQRPSSRTEQGQGRDRAAGPGARHFPDPTGLHAPRVRRRALGAGPTCRYFFCGSLGISSSVSPSTSLPSKRVEGEDDMTILLHPTALHARITLSVPMWLTSSYSCIGWYGPTAAPLCHTHAAPLTALQTAS